MIVARHFATGQWTRIVLDGPVIAAVSPTDGPSDVSSGEEWIAPAFWDIQTNGRWGVSFASAELTEDQVASIVLAQAGLGTARLLPTLITAPRAALIHGLRTIASACERWPDVGRMVAGLHLEGPWISEQDGHRGAHPRESVRDPDPSEFEAMQEAAQGRIALVTLAPERAGAIPFLEKLAARGVVVALGHTAADGVTIRRAVAAGARLSTHLGNGIASPLPRHPNPIWEQAALDDLSASFIADGYHLDDATLRVLVRAKGAARTILVSDASPLAGLPPGQYGEWAIEPSGKVVVAGTPYLAGSNHALGEAVSRLRAVAGFSIEQAIAAVTTNPARLLGRPSPRIAEGEPANLVRFQGGPDGLLGIETCVDGRWFPAGS